MNAVDKYVIYDNIEYTKKGWINRNRFLQNGNDTYFTIPLKKDSDYLNVNERYISENFDRKKLLNQIKAAYQKAPFFSDVFPIFKEIINFESKNLFDFLYNSILCIRNILSIKSELIISSSLKIDHSLKGQNKVLSICKILNANQYYNAIGGTDLYSYEDFHSRGIELKFLKTKEIKYQQFKNEFQPNLSIIDVMMFCSVEQIQGFLSDYQLI